METICYGRLKTSWRSTNRIGRQIRPIRINEKKNLADLQTAADNEVIEYALQN